MIRLLISLTMISPKTAARHVSSDLVPICHRESRCTLKGIHRIDGWLGLRAWKNAVARGLLRPETCIFHRLGPNPERWATSGPFGMVRAYSLPYLPFDCVPPEVLDHPMVAAWVAGQRLSIAKKPGAPTALKRWARLLPLLKRANGRS